MRKCLKCQLAYQDGSRICRACGAILDEVADEPLAVAVFEEEAAAADDYDRGEPASPFDDVVGEPLTPIDLADAVALQPVPTADEWVCTGCGERVPGAFEVCWNCEAAAPGAASSAPESVAAVANVAMSLADGSPDVARRCAACGSDKLLTGVTVLDQGESSSGVLKLVIYGQPEAILFKKPLYGELIADVCGACGHVQLRVRNPTELFAHHQRSRE